MLFLVYKGVIFEIERLRIKVICNDNKDDYL